MTNSYLEKHPELVEEIESIRKNWAIGDKLRDLGLTTPKEIRRYDDIEYTEKTSEHTGVNEKANLLDIYMQKDVQGLMPTIVNIHGGAFVYGNKEIYQFYCMQLALRGFVVVNINYRLAPESEFPASLEDVNSVLTFIEKNGEGYHIDKNKLILVGDSAGGQITSHYAAIYSNPEYAELYDLKLPDVRIAALGLNCGLYDIKKSMSCDTGNMFFIPVGKCPENLSEGEKELLDVTGHITKDYPASFIMSAANDFLLDEAEPMYRLLLSKGVPCKLKIYGTKEQKEIGHVFHVNCRLPEAKICNDEECEFFRCFI